MMQLLVFSLLVFVALTPATESSGQGNQTESQTVLHDAGQVKNETEGDHVHHDAAQQGKVNETDSEGQALLHDVGKGNETEGPKEVLHDAGHVNQTTGQTEVHHDAEHKGNQTEGQKEVYHDAEHQGPVNQTGVLHDVGKGNETEGQTVHHDAGQVKNETEGNHVYFDAAQGKVNDSEGHEVHHDAASSGCWDPFEGNFFKYIDTAMTWAEAQKYCLAVGGNLATIHNQQEEDFVKEVARGLHAWIGFSDAQQEAHWLWINGSPEEFTNWCPGEPNNAGGPQECAVINFSAGKCWDDERCSITRPFVCEKRQKSKASCCTGMH